MKRRASTMVVDTNSSEYDKLNLNMNQDISDEERKEDRVLSINNQTNLKRSIAEDTDIIWDNIGKLECTIWNEFIDGTDNSNFKNIYSQLLSQNAQYFFYVFANKTKFH